MCVIARRASEDGGARGEERSRIRLKLTASAAHSQLVNNGLREPINTIISGHSDPFVLTDAGLRDYVRSIVSSASFPHANAK